MDNARGGLGFWPAIRHAMQLASVMRYLHNDAIPGMCVLHRDLKPDNLGFRGNDIKLVGFAPCPSSVRGSVPALPCVCVCLCCLCVCCIWWWRLFLVVVSCYWFVVAAAASASARVSLLGYACAVFLVGTLVGGLCPCLVGCFCGNTQGGQRITSARASSRNRPLPISVGAGVSLETNRLTRSPHLARFCCSVSPPLPLPLFLLLPPMTIRPSLCAIAGLLPCSCSYRTSDPRASSC